MIINEKYLFGYIEEIEKNIYERSEKGWVNPLKKKQNVEFNYIFNSLTGGETFTQQNWSVVDSLFKHFKKENGEYAFCLCGHKIYNSHVLKHISGVMVRVGRDCMRKIEEEHGYKPLISKRLKNNEDYHKKMEIKRLKDIQQKVVDHWLNIMKERKRSKECRWNFIYNARQFVRKQQRERERKLGLIKEKYFLIWKKNMKLKKISEYIIKIKKLYRLSVIVYWDNLLEFNFIKDLNENLDRLGTEKYPLTLKRKKWIDDIYTRISKSKKYYNKIFENSKNKIEI